MSKPKAYRFRKRPVVIEAYQTDQRVEIQTLEGTMIGDPGDWIITGVNGEQYPCKPDIFRKTYEVAQDCGECDWCKGPGIECRLEQYMDGSG